MLSNGISIKDQIKQPAHYVEGRVIEPLHVIEDWKLNYHLGCAVKYVSRAGRKDCEVSDLQKALCYLDHFLVGCTGATAESYFDKGREYGPNEVALDWKLTTDLSLALEQIYFSTRFKATFHIESAKKLIEHRLKTLTQPKGEA